jgi:FkbM family methyltransferase
MSLRATTVALVLALAGCDLVPNPNQVDEELLRSLAPLAEQAELREYLAKLPDGVYKEYPLDPVGRFYVDNDQDFIKRLIVKNQVWEPWLLAQFAKHVRPGSTVIDAGAHIGVHTVTLAKLAGRRGRVYAFEPQRKIYRELVFNLRLNGLGNVVPLRYALGHTTATVEMDPILASNEGGTHVGRGGDRVEMRTLDSFGFRDVSLIKIDVEHHEDFMLEGAQLTIARSRPVILIEIVGGSNHDKPEPDVKKAIDATKARLESMGYKVQRIYGPDYVALPQ